MARKLAAEVEQKLMEYLATDPEESDRAIGERFGVHGQTVARKRQELKSAPTSKSAKAAPISKTAPAPKSAKAAPISKTAPAPRRRRRAAPEQLSEEDRRIIEETRRNQRWFGLMGDLRSKMGNRIFMIRDLCETLEQVRATQLWKVLPGSKPYGSYRAVLEVCAAPEDLDDYIFQVKRLLNLLEDSDDQHHDNAPNNNGHHRDHRPGQGP